MKKILQKPFVKSAPSITIRHELENAGFEVLRYYHSFWAKRQLVEGLIGLIVFCEEYIYRPVQETFQSPKLLARSDSSPEITGSHAACSER